MTEPRAETTRRIADLETLRGISILMVLVEHARLSGFDWEMPLWHHIGDQYLDFWPGVDVFFAVSGFIIARSLLPAIEACGDIGAFTRVVTAFWVRRAWRLLPSAWLWLWIMLGLSAVFRREDLFGLFHANFESTVAGMLAVANIRFAMTFPLLEYGASSHYWSLSLEEQFYFALPILAYLLRGRLIWLLCAVFAGVAFMTPNSWIGTFRVHAIVLGVMLAMLSRTPAWPQLRPDFLARRLVYRAGLLGVVIFMLCGLAAFGQKVVPAPFTPIALLSAVLVLVAGHDGNFLSLGRVADPVLHWFGARSYAIYIVHLPMMMLHRQIWHLCGVVGAPGLHVVYAASMIAAVLVPAELNYRLVEVPLRRRGAGIATRMLQA